MKQIVCSDCLGVQPTYPQKLRGGRVFLLVCFLFLSGTLVAWSKPILEDMSTGKLPKSSRRAAHDETQGIILTIDSATADVNKGAAQKTKAMAKPRMVIKSKAKSTPRVSNQTVPIKKKLPLKVQGSHPMDAATKVWVDKVAALEAAGTDEALESLDDMAESNPQSPAVHAARARILMRQKDTMEAMEAWKRALALDPQNQVYKNGIAQLNAMLLR